MGSYNNRLFKEGDEEQVVEFLQEVFPCWPPIRTGSSPVEHYRWKYLENPLITQGTISFPLCAVCEYKSEIIGSAHTVPYLLKMGSKTVISSYGGDFAVHIDHRGKGISRELRKFRDRYRAKEGVLYNVGTSDNPIIIERNKRHGYPVYPHKLKSYVIIKNVDLHLRLNKENSLAKKYGYLVMKTLNKVNQRSHKIQGSIKQVSRFNQQYTEFWEEVKNGYKYIIKRDMDYLNWRYCDPRGGIFTVRAVIEDEQVKGYSVLSIHDANPEYPIGVIVDLLTLPGDTVLVKDLVQDALYYFEEKNVNLMKIRVVNNHPYVKVYESLGFIDSRANPYVTIRTLGQTGNEQTEFMNSIPSKVHFPYGDRDTL